MKQNDVDSEELAWKWLDNAQDGPIPTELSSFDTAVLRSLVTLAKSIQPNPAFKVALEEKLQTLQDTKQHVNNRSISQVISHMVNPEN